MKKIILISIFILLFLLNINCALADETSGTGDNNNPSADSANCGDSSCVYKNPLEKAGVKTPQDLIGQVIQTFLGIVGSVALVMFIYGGFVMLLAGGNSEQVTKGKNVLIWATIGLVLIFSSYAIVKFIFEKGVGIKID